MCAGVALGADFALRTGRGNTRVGKSARRGVPLEPVARGLVDVWHLGNRRLRIRRRPQNFIDPALIGRRRCLSAVFQRFAHACFIYLALHNGIANGIAQLCRALTGHRRINTRYQPHERAVFFCHRHGIRLRIAVSLHNQARHALAIALAPLSQHVKDDLARLILAPAPELDLFERVSIFNNHVVTSLMENGAARATFSSLAAPCRNSFFVSRGRIHLRVVGLRALNVVAAHRLNEIRGRGVLSHLVLDGPQELSLDLHGHAALDQAAFAVHAHQQVILVLAAVLEQADADVLLACGGGVHSRNGVLRFAHRSFLRFNSGGGVHSRPLGG
nr:MAG TPA: hypothetical protein [Caudoviricetes sp.]